MANPDAAANADRNEQHRTTEFAGAVRNPGSVFGIIAVIVWIVFVEPSVGIELQYMPCVVSHLVGHLIVQHIGGEQPVGFACGDLFAEPVELGKLDELKLANLKKVGGAGNFSPFRIFHVVRADQGFEKIYGHIQIAPADRSLVPDSRMSLIWEGRSTVQRDYALRLSLQRLNA
jgi:hypothetical protein